MNYKLSDILAKLMDSKLNNVADSASIIAIEGGVNFRKTFTLNELEEFIKIRPDTKYSRIMCSDTSSNSSVNYHRPLSIIKKSIEDLENDNSSTKRAFYKSVALSISTMIPIVGEFTFTGKEIFKDYKEYKNSKRADISSLEQDQIKETLTELIKVTKKKTSILFFDDFEKADQLSVKFIQDIAEKIKYKADNNLKNFIIIFTYNGKLLKSKGYSLLSLIKANEDNNLFETISLKPFTKEQIHYIGTKEIVNYQNKNDKFIVWIYDKTIGVPGDVLKYFEYFKSNPPFEENGELKSNFDSLDYIPDSLQRNFSTTLDNLTEDEKNILTTASAFGYEFSINLLKDILNTDPLKLIRQLRSIYTKTNIISSLGAFTQFGVKTTIYRFSQAYYQRYFKDLIEHEEKINLNSLIQANYQKIYDNTTDENIIKELTPLIAIHSKEAEDFETSKKMFLQTAKIAFADGNQEAVEEATEQVKNMEQNPNSGAAVDMNSLNRMLDIFSNNKEYSEKEITEITESIIEENSNPNLVSTSTNILEFTDYRKQLVEIYLGKKFLETVNSIQQYYSSNESTLNISEKVQLICIALNSYIAQGDLDSSTQLYEKALIQFKSDEIDQISKCLLANSLALYEYKKNNKSSSRDLLLDAAKKSLRLPIEFKLLTLSNIYKFEFFDDMDEKQKIKLTIDHYSKKLQFAEFRKDLGFDS